MLSFQSDPTFETALVDPQSRVTNIGVNVHMASKQGRNIMNKSTRLTKLFLCKIQIFESTYLINNVSFCEA